MPEGVLPGGQSLQHNRSTDLPQVQGGKKMFNFGKNLPAAALRHVDRSPSERSPALINSSRGQPYIPKRALDRKEIKGFNDT